MYQVLFLFLLINLKLLHAGDTDAFPVDPQELHTLLYSEFDRFEDPPPAVIALPTYKGQPNECKWVKPPAIPTYHWLKSNEPPSTPSHSAPISAAPVTNLGLLPSALALLQKSMETQPPPKISSEKEMVEFSPLTTGQELQAAQKKHIALAAKLKNKSKQAWQTRKARAAYTPPRSPEKKDTSSVEAASAMSPQVALDFDACRKSDRKRKKTVKEQARIDEREKRRRKIEPLPAWPILQKTEDGTPVLIGTYICPCGHSEKCWKNYQIHACTMHGDTKHEQKKCTDCGRKWSHPATAHGLERGCPPIDPETHRRAVVSGKKKKEGRERKN